MLAVQCSGAQLVQHDEFISWDFLRNEITLGQTVKACSAEDLANVLFEAN